MVIEGPQGERRRTRQGRSAAEDVGRETFLSREEAQRAGEESRTNDVAAEALEAKPSFGQISPSRDRGGACFDSRSDDRPGELANRQARRKARRRASGQSSVQIGVSGPRAERCPTRLPTPGFRLVKRRSEPSKSPGSVSAQAGSFHDTVALPPLAHGPAPQIRGPLPQRPAQSPCTPLQPVWRLRASGAPISAGTCAVRARPWVRPAREAGSGGPAR